MSARPKFQRTRRRRRPFRRQLLIEALELRSLPSASWPYAWAPLVAPPGHDTLDQAIVLGALNTPTVGPAVVQWYDQAAGTIGAGPAGAADVDWFSFTLTIAADVKLTTPRDLAGPKPVVPVLTLYNNAPLNPNDFTQNDPYTPNGHRLLAQDDGAAHGGVATIEQDLAPGTYYVAVSGTGDHDFNPFIAGSGEAGGTGSYALLITAASLPGAAGLGPVVVAATPGGGAILDASPLAIRLALSSALDPTTIQPGVNVVLTGPNGPVQLQQNAVNGVDPTNGAVFNADANELQVFPEAPLAPGIYQLRLVGQDGQGVPVILGTNGAALGSTTAGSLGQDYTLTFQVAGIDGVAGASTSDDTIATAHELGDVTASGPVRVSGAIGVDPLTSTPANQVDLYHFQVTGSGRYAFVAEADAGRIGSSLQPALALFEMVNGQPQLVAADGSGTGNQTLATDGTMPLLSDAVVYAGLTAGDYYLAVGGLFNLPDPTVGLPPGTFGVFDPTQDGSAQSGFSVGNYLLNLSLRPDNVAPHVTEVDGLASPTPAMPPTFITVHFDEAMNVRQLGYQQDLQGGTTPFSAVWVQGSDGANYPVRLRSYDDATHVATFYLLDAVPDGPAALYLAGTLPDGSPGLTDLAGNLIVGSDANGDYVVPFTVGGPARVINPVTRRLTWTSQGGGTSQDQPQVIGPLFPDETGYPSTGVDVLGRLTPQSYTGAGADPVDFYQIEVLQDGDYSFTLIDSRKGYARSPTNAVVRVFTLDHQEITTNSGNPFIFDFPLAAGKYVIEVGPLAASRTTALSYRLTIAMGASSESAVALTIGAAPPYSIGLQRAGSPGAPSSPPSSAAPGSPPGLSLPTAPGAGGVVPATTLTAALGGGGAGLSLPAGAALGLSAPPVGGVRGDAPQAPAGIAQLELPPAGLQGSVQPAVLATSSGPTDVGTGGADGAGVVDQLYRLLDAMSRAAVLRAMPSSTLAGWLSHWLRGLYVPLTPITAPPAGAEDGNEEGDDAPEAIEAVEPPPLEGTDWLWASGVLAAGALIAGPVAQQRRRTFADRTMPRLQLR
jgi:hypothetical protein